MIDFKLLLSLYFSFFKIGALTFGGGQAMLPVIQREAVGVKKWATEEEINNIIAISQSLPGALVVNCAIALGYKVQRLKGAIATTLGIITPSLLIIILISMFFEDMQNYDIIGKVFSGIRAVIVALVLIAFINMYKTSVLTKVQFFIFLITVISVLFIGIYPPYLILFGAVFSLVIGYLFNSD